MEENMNQSLSFMAFAGGSESKEFVRNYYIGVGIVRLLAVNPTAAEIEKYLGYKPKEEPIYTSTTDDGKKEVRISFIAETDPEKNNGIEWKGIISYKLTDGPNTNGDGTKIQVIDNYGETAWATIDDFKAQQLPSYARRLLPPVRQAYKGEQNLIKMLKVYINIPDATKYNSDDRSWYKIDNLKEAEASLEDIAKYFLGNVTELKQIISLQPNNSFKLLFTVREYNGNLYQSFYLNEPMRLGTRSYKRLEEQLEKDAQDGRLNGVTYEICELKQYTETPTQFDDPLGAGSAPANSPWSTWDQNNK
jgi:hypothetical protein